MVLLQYKSAYQEYFTTGSIVLQARTVINNMILSCASMLLIVIVGMKTFTDGGCVVEWGFSV